MSGDADRDMAQHLAQSVLVCTKVIGGARGPRVLAMVISTLLEEMFAQVLARLPEPEFDGDEG